MTMLVVFGTASRMVVRKRYSVSSSRQNRTLMRSPGSRVSNNSSSSRKRGTAVMAWSSRCTTTHWENPRGPPLVGQTISVWPGSNSRVVLMACPSGSLSNPSRTRMCARPSAIFSSPLLVGRLRNFPTWRSNVFSELINSSGFLSRSRLAICHKSWHSDADRPRSNVAVWNDCQLKRRPRTCLTTELITRLRTNISSSAWTTSVSRGYSARMRK